MAVKFQRQYKLSVQTKSGGYVHIELPFKVDFDIKRHTYAPPNAFSFKIYNLSRDIRESIRKDDWDLGEVREVFFSAGYGDELILCGKGNVRKCEYHREGVDIVTTIDCFDGGLAYGAESNRSFIAGTPKREVVKTLVNDFKRLGVTEGVIGEVKGNLLRGNTYFGSIFNNLKELTNDNFFVDMTKANVLSDEEIIKSNTFLVNEASGLLSVPSRQETFIEFDMLFEPNVQVGSLVDLKSSVNSNFDGENKVLRVNHRGTISESNSGSAITTLSLQYGKFIERLNGS